MTKELSNNLAPFDLGRRVDGDRIVYRKTKQGCLVLLGLPFLLIGLFLARATLTGIQTGNYGALTWIVAALAIAFCALPIYLFKTALRPKMILTPGKIDVLTGSETILTAADLRGLGVYHGETYYPGGYSGTSGDKTYHQPRTEKESRVVAMGPDGKLIPLWILPNQNQALDTVIDDLQRVVGVTVEPLKSIREGSSDKPDVGHW